MDKNYNIKTFTDAMDKNYDIKTFISKFLYFKKV